MTRDCIGERPDGHVLVVKVELWREGSAAHAYELHRLHITDDGHVGAVGVFGTEPVGQVAVHNRSVWSVVRSALQLAEGD